MRADEAEKRADQAKGLLTRLAAAEVEAKSAHDRAWASGEAISTLREQLTTLQQRVEAERARADRVQADAAACRRRMGRGIRALGDRAAA